MLKIGETNTFVPSNEIQLAPGRSWGFGTALPRTTGEPPLAWHADQGTLSQMLGRSTVFTAPAQAGTFTVGVGVAGYPEPENQSTTSINVVGPGVYLEGLWIDGQNQQRQHILASCSGLTRPFHPLFIGRPVEPITWTTNGGTVQDLGNGEYQFVPSGSYTGYGPSFVGTIQSDPNVQLRLYDCFVQ